MLRYAGATTLQRFFIPEAVRFFRAEIDICISIAVGITDPGIGGLLKDDIDMAGAGRHLLTEAEKTQGLVEHFFKLGCVVCCDQQ